MTSSKLTVNAACRMVARDNQTHDADGNQQSQETDVPEAIESESEPCRPHSETGAVSSGGRYRDPTCCPSAKRLPEMSHRTGTMENPSVLFRLKFNSACRGGSDHQRCSFWLGNLSFHRTPAVGCCNYGVHQFR